MDNIMNEEIVKEYVSFDDLMKLAEDIPCCEDKGFPNAGALAKTSNIQTCVDFELG